MSDLEFVSAGTGALDGGGASEGAILVGLERGIDLSTHRTRALTPELLSGVDLVLVMGPHHLDAVLGLAPDARVHLLDDFASGGSTADPINDPFGGTLDAYRDTASEMERLIEAMLDRLEKAA